MPQTNMANQLPPENVFRGKITCEEALKKVRKITVGMKDSEILDLLGTPTAVSEDAWSYSFFACAKPKIGDQVIVGVGILFKEKAVSEIGWATVCTMGVVNAAKQKTRKKKT